MSVINKETHNLLNEVIITELNAKGINTIYQFIDKDSEVLSKTTKLPLKSILSIKKHILRKNAAVERNAFDYYKEMLQKTAIISSNYPNLDEILGGGFFTGNIYEICGKTGSYLSRFCYTFIAQFVAKHKNQQKVIFYDTTFCFNPNELKTLSGNNEQVLENVLVERTTDLYQLIAALYELKEQFERKQIKLRVAIIDSLPPIFYHTATMEKTNMLINCLINIMRLIMTEYHVVFIVVNLLMSKSMNGDRIETLCGGKYWQTLPNTRLKLICDKNTDRDITVIKSNQGNVDQTCKILL